MVTRRAATGLAPRLPSRQPINPGSPSRTRHTPTPLGFQRRRGRRSLRRETFSSPLGNSPGSRPVQQANPLRLSTRFLEQAKRSSRAYPVTPKEHGVEVTEIHRRPRYAQLSVFEGPVGVHLDSRHVWTTSSLNSERPRNCKIESTIRPICRTRPLRAEPQSVLPAPEHLHAHHQEGQLVPLRHIEFGARFSREFAIMSVGLVHIQRPVVPSDVPVAETTYAGARHFVRECPSHGHRQ